MNNSQKKDLFIEWSLYEPKKQRSMIEEYCQKISAEECSKENFLEFLKDKLKVEGYWKKVGLA